MSRNFSFTMQAGRARRGRCAGPGGSVRPVTARITPERALELLTELIERVREAEDDAVEPLVITAVFHPPTRQAMGEAES